MPGFDSASWLGNVKANEFRRRSRMPASDRDAVKPSAVSLPGTRAAAMQAPERLTRVKPDAAAGRTATNQSPASGAIPRKG
jgi:hypothetical protein